MGWKDLTPEDRAKLVAVAINETGLSIVSTDPEVSAKVDDAGIRIIAEAIREAQEAVRKP